MADEEANIHAYPNSLRSVSLPSERQLPGAARPSIRVRSERVGPLLGKRPLQSSPLGDGFQGRCDPFWRAAWKDTQPAASDALLQHSAQDRKPAIESGLARNQPGANLVPIRRAPAGSLGNASTRRTSACQGWRR